MDPKLIKIIFALAFSCFLWYLIWKLDEILQFHEIVKDVALMFASVAHLAPTANRRGIANRAFRGEPLISWNQDPGKNQVAPGKLPGSDFCP